MVSFDFINVVYTRINPIGNNPTENFCQSERVVPNSG